VRFDYRRDDLILLDLDVRCLMTGHVNNRGFHRILFYRVISYREVKDSLQHENGGDNRGWPQPFAQSLDPCLNVRRLDRANLAMMVTRDLTKVFNDQYPAETKTRDYLDQLAALTAVPAAS
jgi:hypothetical protein